MYRIKHSTLWCKHRFAVVNTQNVEFILALLCIDLCPIFRTNNCKLSFVPPCIYRIWYYLQFYTSTGSLGTYPPQISGEYCVCL